MFCFWCHFLLFLCCVRTVMYTCVCVFFVQIKKEAFCKERWEKRMQTAKRMFRKCMLFSFYRLLQFDEKQNVTRNKDNQPHDEYKLSECKEQRLYNVFFFLYLTKKKNTTMKCLVRSPALPCTAYVYYELDFFLFTSFSHSFATISNAVLYISLAHASILLELCVAESKEFANCFPLASHIFFNLNSNLFLCVRVLILAFKYVC